MPVTKKARTMQLLVHEGETEDKATARVALGPLASNASTAADFSVKLMGDLSLDDCMAVMREDIQAVNAGDLSNLEGLLTGQAVALNVMFNSYAKAAAHAKELAQLDAFARLAMKAQAQCRTTIEALAEMKFPKSATFIKQANIAHQQQVNNGSSDGSRMPTPARTRQKDITPTNELLPEAHSATLDCRGPSAAGGANPGMEAVDALDRAG